MAHDPRCADVVAALAVGDPVDPAHLASCPGCRAHAALAEALRAAPRPSDAAPSHRPDPAALGAAVRARRVRAAALAVGTGLVLVAALAVAPSARWGAPAGQAEPPLAAAPPAADPDLFAALDDADRALDPAALPEDELVALLEPGDPLADPDPLEAALLGDWSL